MTFNVLFTGILSNAFGVKNGAKKCAIQQTLIGMPLPMHNDLVKKNLLP